MYCPGCGRPHDETDSFCPACGAPLAAVAPAGPEGAGGPAAGIRTPWRGRQVLAGILLVAGSVALVSLLALPLQDREHGMAILTWLGSHVVGVVILVVVGLLGLWRYRASVSVLGLKSVGWPRRSVLLLTVGVLAASLGATMLYGLLVSALGLEQLAPPTISPEIVLPGAGALLTFEALALWTPLTEELFFRGFVFAGLLARWGPVRAIGISALVFSIFHPMPGVLIPVFITGILLAWLYYRTGSLWPSITAHAGQNTVALLVTIFGA